MKYFTVKELYKSGTANKYGIDNVPNKTDEQRLVEMINNLLDPVRELWGKPVFVTNGYRSPALIVKMKEVGYKVSPTTAHAYGYAADITTGNKADNKRLFNLIANSNLKFDQLIDENNYSWIHLGWKKLPEDKQREQILHLIG
jgi:hypothetical protein